MHISALADRFVKDPHDVVKTGDVVSVRVIDVDVKRKRIALSMRSDSETARPAKREAGDAQSREPRARTERKSPPRAQVANNPFADALAGWKKK